MRQSCLSQKTWFSMEAHLQFLRSPLNSWYRNKSRSGLKFWFPISVGLARKMRQSLTGNFHSLSQKMWHFVNNSKYRQIIYHFEDIREPVNISRISCCNSLPLGRKMVGNPLPSWENVLKFRWVSLGTKGTSLQSLECWV